MYQRGPKRISSSGLVLNVRCRTAVVCTRLALAGTARLETGSRLRPSESIMSAVACMHTSGVSVGIFCWTSLTRGREAESRARNARIKAARRPSSAPPWTTACEMLSMMLEAASSRCRLRAAASATASTAFFKAGTEAAVIASRSLHSCGLQGSGRTCCTCPCTVSHPAREWSPDLALPANTRPPSAPLRNVWES